MSDDTNIIWTGGSRIVGADIRWDEATTQLRFVAGILQQGFLEHRGINQMPELVWRPVPSFEATQPQDQER